MVPFGMMINGPRLCILLQSGEVRLGSGVVWSLIGCICVVGTGSVAAGVDGDGCVGSVCDVGGGCVGVYAAARG